MDNNKKSFKKLTTDVLRPLKKHKGFDIWLFFLIVLFAVSVLAYLSQLSQGLGVTGMRDFVSWGMYIGHFVFCVAVSLVGMLISSIMGLLKIKWITPITRLAEFIAIAFVAVAGIAIIVDMGRPDRFFNVIFHGRLQSPILWDVTVVTTYLVLSVLLLILPMVPDMAFSKRLMKDAPKWRLKLYNLLSFGYMNTPEQYKALHKLIRILMVLIIPVGLAIHTVTSWLFAATLHVGWDTTIFGPYFVSGAFVAGVASLSITMYVIRANFKLEYYITKKHFDLVAKLMVLVSLVYLYFNINEFIVPGYKMKQGDNVHLSTLFYGSWSGYFWSAQILGMILPIVLFIFKPMRKPIPVLIVSVLVLIGAWLKRYVIVIPTLLHPHLPIPEYIPENYHTYVPTGVEITITAGTFILVLLIITILAKLFPVIPFVEYAENEKIEIDYDILNENKK